MKRFVILFLLMLVLFLPACSPVDSGADSFDYTGGASATYLDDANSDMMFNLSKYGMMNGMFVQPGYNSFQALLSPFGYGFDESLDGFYEGVYLVNPDMPELDFCLYPYRLSLSDIHDSSEIESNGFASYHISAAYSDIKPNMNWGGVSFNAGEQDIIDVYGEPDYCDVYDNYVTLGYDFGNCELNFSVFDEVDMLTQIQNPDLEYEDTGLQLIDFYVF